MNNKKLREYWDFFQEKIKELGFELLDIEMEKFGPDNCLVFYIYRPEGVGLDDCEQVSRILSPIMDELDPIKGSYLLSVSSPDLSRPLKTDRQLEINLGEEVSIHFYKKRDGAKSIVGRLGDFDENFIFIDNGQGREKIDRKEVSQIKLEMNVGDEE